MKIAVLVSGGGTNLQAIIDAINDRSLENIQISCVIADRDCYAIDRCLEAEIPVFIIDRDDEMDDNIQTICTEHAVDFIVLAGFLSILSAEFCNTWENKIINLHPSLLPKYGGIGMYGSRVHKAVLNDKATKSGATVHYVTSGIDEGEIILQESFNIPEGSDLKWLQEKISTIEKPLLIEAIKKISQDFN